MAKNRRGNNEGSIFQRADGRWVGQVALPGDSRVQRRRKTVYARTRDEARRKLIETQKQLLDGLNISTGRGTVANFIKEWLASIRPSVRYKTFETYEGILRNHVVRHIGHIQLARLSAPDIQRMYVDLLAEGRSPSSVAKLHSVLHNMLGKAVRWDRLIRNVSELVDPPRPVRREKVMLSPDQVRGFLNAVRGHRLEALFTLAITTGARSGELLGLTWGNTDLEQGVMSIRQSLQKLEDGYGLGDPKTKRSRRDVALPVLAIRSLKSHRSRQAAEALRLGAAWSNDLDLVFTTRFGTKLNSNDVLSREFRPLLQRAGLPTQLRFQDLRDIAASLLLASQPVTDVSDMLGHADPSITMRVYAHALPGAPRRMADAMDKLLGA